MNPREAHLLSPYRPPTSYPVSLNPDEAEAWLQGYFTLWHPAALLGRTRTPQASSPHDHETPIAEFLYALPTGPHLYLPDLWNERAREASAIVFHATTDRAETTANMLAALREAGRTEPQLDASPEAVQLFAAIGYGYLLIESLFDSMEHEHLLDAEGFWTDIHDAVELLAQPDSIPAIREKLKSASGKLDNARQVLNSNTIRLFDIIMPDTGHWTGPWPQSIAAGLPISLIASGEMLLALRDHAPERFAELKARIIPDLPSTIDICCGAFREREDAMLLAESQQWNLSKARETVRELFDAETVVYARKRSAFHPQLPAWLKHAGFANAVIVTFDGSLTPSRNSAVVSWSSPDGTTIESFGRDPHSASDPLTFFNFVYHLNQAMTQDSTPAVALKHTGEPTAVGYAELITLAELGDAVGEWCGLSRFLAEQHYGDYLGTTTADDYFTDYLDDRVTNLHRPEAVSGFAKHARLRRKLDSAFAMAALQRTLSPIADDEPAWIEKLEQAEDAVETRGVDTETPLPEAEQQIEEVEAVFAQKLAERVQVRSEDGKPGIMVFNPCNFTRRVALEIDNFGGPIPIADPVKAAEFSGSAAKLVVEVPSLGFAWIPKPTSANGAVPKQRIKTAEGSLVRNEFIEAEFDPATGALRAFRDLRTRMNRLGMQMIFQPGSKTRGRSVTITNSGTALGEAICEGDILDEHDAVLARYRNRIRAWMGRPALELRIEIEPVHKPTGYPWHAYYGARFVWRDQRAAIFRGVNGANTQSTYTRPVSPDYLETRLGSERSFVFTGGLPFIQKHGARMADVVLVPEGEQCQTFDLLLACDRDYPMQTAAGWYAPAPLVHTTKGPPSIGPSGWLGHVDLPSLLMTSFRPVTMQNGTSRAVAMRLVECAGFGGASEVRFARDATRAFLVNAEGEVSREIAIVDGAVPVDFSAGETFRITAEWE